MNESFLKRFHSVRAHKHRTLIGEALARIGLCLFVGLVLVVASDYWWELDRTLRQASLAAIAMVAVAYALRSLIRLSHVWSTSTTAAEIEQTFPELGQSIRTSVQFGSMNAMQVQAEGVATSLVTALVEETHRRALPLTIEDVIPTHRLWFIAGTLAACVIGCLTVTSFDWEWRTAATRTLLNDVRYRDLLVEPGNQIVDEGATVQLSAKLIGRSNRTVVLYSRLVEQSDVDWTERVLTSDSDADSAKTAVSRAEDDRSLPRPEARFDLQFDRVTKALEYYVRAGELQSPVYRIRVRRPLRIESIAVDLTPPSYTGQSSSTTRDGNVVALEGTQARFAVTFDKRIKTASLILAVRAPIGQDDAVPEPQVLPLEVTSEIATALSSSASEFDLDDVPEIATVSLPLLQDGSYTIQAEARDGTVLGPNKYRIRVRQDQPPQVFFESPDEKIEVHTLAELPMRVRVRDDYGLLRAGILFQINNEQEIPLVDQDFAVVATAAEEVAAT